jgi:hypothetical protein
MIGTKQLSAIRSQIAAALAAAGADPIQRLERQIAASRRKGNRTEVLEGLQRFLKSPPQKTRRKRRAGAKS